MSFSFTFTAKDKAEAYVRLADAIPYDVNPSPVISFVRDAVRSLIVDEGYVISVNAYGHQTGMYEGDRNAGTATITVSAVKPT